MSRHLSRGARRHLRLVVWRRASAERSARLASRAREGYRLLLAANPAPAHPPPWFDFPPPRRWFRLGDPS